jgi:hypothetical protein
VSRGGRGGWTAEIARVVAACRALSDLDGWPFVGERIEAARAALAGADGISDAEIDRLCDVAERWSSLDPRLRRFYGGHLRAGCAPGRLGPERSIDLAARRILLRDPAPLPGWRYAVLRDLWASTFGVEPAIEIVPIQPRPPR